MDKELWKQGIATADDVGNGLFCITDPKVLAVLPCRELTQQEEFLSYCQLSQHVHKNK
jgi:hypothetical protein